MEESRKFYTEFLGFNIGMHMDWIMTFVSPQNPTAQPSSQMPAISIEVVDVDSVHAKAAEQGIKIVYPLTSEPWGVRRFFAVDPNGVIINVLSHVKKA
jgi:catechol 2,3-dioxygenase-like lactoylglutathione lyase family enzyme